MRNEISGDFITELERNVYYSNNKHKDTDGNFFLLERRYNENETKKAATKCFFRWKIKGETKY